MDCKLSILIPILYPRDKESSNKLLEELSRQCGGVYSTWQGVYPKSIPSQASWLCSIIQYNNGCEAVVFPDEGEHSIGEKRQWCLDNSKGNYICFIDADDEISKDYISKVLKALENEPDCTSLTGVITWDGTNPEIFEHSLQYDTYKTNPKGHPIIYERFPNHLNTIKRKIAINYTFVHKNHGEDTLWASDIHKDKVLKTETKIDGVIYHYKFKPNK